MLYIKPKQMQCGELEFLKKFLSSGFFEKMNQDPSFEISLIQEPFTGFGYADLVCVIWDKDVGESWNENRNSLELRDIKILHHLFNCKIYQNISSIVKDLGFDERHVCLSVEKLLSSELVKVNQASRVKIKPISEIFFVKEIISIEAKLHDWKRALEQALNNTYFSSKSYTLFPDEIVTENLVNTYSQTDVGIISFGSECKVLKKPKRNSIPSTLSSWFFNEYIGRKIWETT